MLIKFDLFIFIIELKVICLITNFLGICQNGNGWRCKRHVEKQIGSIPIMLIFKMLYMQNLIKLLLSVLVVVFIFFDEEPIFDITDLSLYTVLVLSVSMLSVLFDNSIKAIFGSLVSKDITLWFYSTTTSISIIMYIVIIWFVFFLHMTAPLLADSCDTVWTLNNLVSSVEVFLIFFGYLLVFIRLILVLLNTTNETVRIKLLSVITLVILYLVIVLSIELVTRFYTFSTVITNNTNILQPTISILGSSYVQLPSNKRDFIWHLSRSDSSVEFSLTYASFLAILVVWLHIVVLLIFSIVTLFVTVFYTDVVNKVIYGFTSLLDMFIAILLFVCFAVIVFFILRDLQYSFFVI